MCLYVQMPLNVKSSKICLKEVIFSTRSSYVTTAIMNVSEQLTAEVNKHVNTAKEKIIREFATIEEIKETKSKSSGQQPLFVAKDSQVACPVIVVNEDGIKFKALLDTEAGTHTYLPL